MFPIFNTFLSTSDKKFELYCVQRDIKAFCFHDEVKTSDLEFFHNLAKNFILNFHDTFPTKTIIPKMHYLLHYRNLILSVGPLVYHSTLPTERKHQKAKRIIESCRSFIDLSATILNNFFFNLEKQFESEERVLKKFNNLSEIDEQYRDLIPFDIRQNCAIE